MMMDPNADPLRQLQLQMSEVPANLEQVMFRI
jgi:hypothetical protein